MANRRKGQSLKAPGPKGHGVTGDPHAPKMPPVKVRPPHQNSIPAKKR